MPPPACQVGPIAGAGFGDDVGVAATGTLTAGRPVATDFMPLADAGARELRSIAVALAARSDHPVSRAIAAAARQDGLTATEAAGLTALPGRGVRGGIGAVSALG